MPALYGTLDVNLNHFRRYDREPLRALLEGSGFQVETLRYINRIGGVRLVVELARAEAQGAPARPTRGVPVDPAAPQTRREIVAVIRPVPPRSGQPALERSYAPASRRLADSCVVHFWRLE